MSMARARSNQLPLDYGGGLISSGSDDACGLISSGSSSSSDSTARDDLSRALDIKNGAPNFELGLPDRSELRTIAKALRREHASDQSFDLIDSTDGFSSIDAVEAWIIDAWKRKEILVLHHSPPRDIPAAAAAAAWAARSGRASELLVQGSDRWLLPAFATVCVKKALLPYIELLWVSHDVRRMGIGSLIVREICRDQPGITRVKSCLHEALPFWDAVSDSVTRSTRMPDKPIATKAPLKLRSVAAS